MGVEWGGVVSGSSCNKRQSALYNTNPIIFTQPAQPTHCTDTATPTTNPTHSHPTPQHPPHPHPPSPGTPCARILAASLTPLSTAPPAVLACALTVCSPANSTVPR